MAEENSVSGQEGKGFGEWVNARFPLRKIWREHVSEYYAPKNFNFWYFFGSLALLVLVNQLLTGLWLTMFYTPSAEKLFRRSSTSCGKSSTAGCYAICTPQGLRLSL